MCKISDNMPKLPPIKNNYTVVDNSTNTVNVIQNLKKNFCDNNGISQQSNIFSNQITSKLQHDDSHSVHNRILLDVPVFDKEKHYLVISQSVDFMLNSKPKIELSEITKIARIVSDILKGKLPKENIDNLDFHLTATFNSVLIKHMKTLPPYVPNNTDSNMKCQWERLAAAVAFSISGFSEYDVDNFAKTIPFEVKSTLYRTISDCAKKLGECVDSTPISNSNYEEINKKYKTTEKVCYRISTLFTNDEVVKKEPAGYFGDIKKLIKDKKSLYVRSESNFDKKKLLIKEIVKYNCDLLGITESISLNVCNDKSKNALCASSAKISYLAKPKNGITLLNSFNEKYVLGPGKGKFDAYYISINIEQNNSIEEVVSSIVHEFQHIQQFIDIKKNALSTNKDPVATLFEYSYKNYISYDVLLSRGIKKDIADLRYKFQPLERSSFQYEENINL